MKDESCPSPQRKQGWRLTLLTLRARTDFILHPSFDAALPLGH